MLAVDTNVVVRFLARDDPKQSARAGQLIRDNPVWIAKTVLLEVEWVLRGAYAFPSDRIAESLRGLLGLPQVEVEDAPEVAQALDWFAAGIDFADALHLAASGKARGFATFDRKFAAKARRLTAMNLVTLP